MNRTAWKTMALTFVGMLACVPHGMAQQDPSPRPHAPGIRMAADTHDDHDEHAHGLRGHRGPMGHEGLRLQQHFEQLTQQLKLTDQQRVQVWTILYNQAKDMIRLRAELATLRLDVPPLLEAEPVDLAKVKQQFLAIATKEVDLQMAYVTAMQALRQVLTPDQRQHFKTVHGPMMYEEGRRAHQDRRERRERD